MAQYHQSAANRPRRNPWVGRLVSGRTQGPMKILIVDDEAGTRLMVATAVEHLGHRAIQAADGDEGWAASSSTARRS